MKRRLSEEIQNINAIMNKVKIDIRETVENCKDIDSLNFDSILSEDTFKGGFQQAIYLLEEAALEYNNLIGCITKNFVDEYRCCNIEEDKLIHKFDADWSIPKINMRKVEKKYNEKEEETQKALDVFIKNKSKGLSAVGLIAGYMLNKSGTINKMFKEAEPIIFNMIDSVACITADFFTTEISAIIDRNTDIGKENIIYLLKYNKQDIEKYIEDRKKILRNTNSDIQMMEKIMVSINKYKNIIKETN